MPCSNCNSAQYADWVAEMAEIVVRNAEIDVAIGELNEEKQQNSTRYSQLYQLKMQCDMAGGPGS